MSNVTPIRPADGDGGEPSRGFPCGPVEKLITATGIIKAVLAAHDAGADMGDYDMHWPLSMAIELLEQAKGEIDD